MTAMPTHSNDGTLYYKWNTDETTASIVVTPTSIGEKEYTVIVTDSIGNCSAKATATFAFTVKDTVRLTFHEGTNQNPIICLGNPIEEILIDSAHCAPLYGLEILKTDIQNNSNNHTRFICISRQPEIYPGADRTSLMLALPNRPGALYQLLGRFYAQGINLTKLESRPVPGRDFEFMFCFDIDASVYSPAFIRLIEELDVTLEKCAYLGSYTELV